MSHLEDADNLNPVVNVAGRPVVQAVNPNKEICTSERSTKLPRLCNAYKRDSLAN